MSTEPEVKEPIVEEQEEIQTESPDVEKEARLQGWVPKEEYRGNQDDWIDADTFVKRGKEINPILRKNNERFKAELEKTKNEIAELRAAAEEFKKFQKDAYDRKVSELDKELSKLRQAKIDAVKEGDGDLLVDIDDRIDAIKEEKAAAKEETKKEPPKVEVKLDPALEQWKEENSWYVTDATMTATTNLIAERIAASFPGLKGKAFLDKLDEELLEVFKPEKLGKKAKPRTPVESSRSSGTPKASAKSYENLPPEAKSACDKFVRQKLMTREDYVSAYDWS